MTFLPIVERELRVASRRRATYWRRFVAAALALGILVFILAVSRNETSNQIGLAVFVGLSCLMFIGAIIVGTQVTADCLSEEKREGTLGLLFLTDLKGYDIVYGKLAATAVALFYDLLAIVPVLAIPMMLGGVTNGEFARVVMVDINLLFLSVAIGVFCSAVSNNGVQSAIRAVALLVLIVATVPIIVFVVAMNNGADLHSLLILSPATSCFIAYDENYRRAAFEFWTNSAITFALGWLFLWLACRAVPNSWQESTVESKPKPQPVEPTPANGDSDWQGRARHLNENPYQWRAFRGNQTIVGCLGMAVVVIFWFCCDTNAGTVLTTMIFMHLVLKIWMSIEACRPFAEDRRQGVMELLLSTPLTESDLVHGQRLALFRIFTPPLIFVLGCDMVVMFTPNDNSTESIESYIACIGFLIADLYVLSWVGPWLGLKARSASAAVRSTLSRVIIIPAAIAIGLSMLVATVENNNFWHLFYFIWILTGVIADVVLCQGAITGLNSRFREFVFAARHR